MNSLILYWSVDSTTGFFELVELLFLFFLGV